MNKKYSDTQIKEFINRTTQELIIQDPQSVLDDLGIEYKEIGNDSYRMNLRNEKTPSAYISLKNGSWKYKDFGTGNNGSIVNVVMDSTSKNYKEALNYSLSKLGVKNYLSEALQSKTESYELSNTDKQRIQAQRENNKQRESSHAVSRVTTTHEVSSNQLAVNYLKSRGILKIPPQFKIINGEYTNKQGETKKAFGVGVLTKNGTGADIHFLHKIGDLKSMSFGEKDISFYKNPQSSKVAVFESKMDYASAYQQMPLDNVNIVIANSTSNAAKVAEFLKKEDLTQNVMMFGQNDLSGFKFIVDIAKQAELKDFKSISYDVMGEYKKDINDLHIDGEKIADRITSTQNLEYFESVYNSLKAIHKAQTSVNRVVNKEDVKEANKEHHIEHQQRER